MTASVKALAEDGYITSLAEHDYIKSLLRLPPIPPTQNPPNPAYRVPMSRSTHTFDLWISKLFQALRQGIVFSIRNFSFSIRLSIFRSLTVFSWPRRLLYFFLLFCYEIFMPFLWLVLTSLALIGRLLATLRVPLPMLSILYWAVFRNSLLPSEVLPPGENGYTRVFDTRHNISLTDLQEALSARNVHSLPTSPDTSINTISLSYKHYADPTSRLSHLDLLAIHRLIQTLHPCKLRFWIDSKLPPSNDPTFERWIDRGVRPYARYITFLCPSALQYRNSSFWLANEYHFSLSSKGVLFFDSQSNLILEYLEYDKISVDHRFLHMLIDPHPHVDHFRQDDRAKFVRWAAAYLSTKLPDSFMSSSHAVDTITLPERYVDELLDRIESVVRAYGEQSLPVVHGRSWDGDNPLLLADPCLAGFLLQTWVALVNVSNEQHMNVVYILLNARFQRLAMTKVVVLVLTLDKPFCYRTEAHVVSKVLREVEREVLIDCVPVYMASPDDCKRMKWK